MDLNPVMEIAQILGGKDDPVYGQFLEDREKYTQLLKQNKDKNFVQRILNPKLSLEGWAGPGTSGTHAMSYSGDKDGGFYVYPEIIYDPKTDKLKYFGKKNRKAAFDHALKTGEFIRFDNEEEAEKFGSYGYKAAWGDPKIGFEIYKFGYKNAQKTKE